jgi:DNA-binding HxlR family transcriptional regulator
MRRKARTDSPEPIDRAVERLGEGWSLLILAAAFAGEVRFDGFRRAIGIPPTTLSTRLAHLVAAGIMERRLYCTAPPRHEYRLTSQGLALGPMVDALKAWGATLSLPPDAAQ